MALLSDVIQSGTRAAQPAATAVAAGVVYFVTDEGELERSTGAAWVQVAVNTTAHDAHDHTGVPGVGGAGSTPDVYLGTAPYGTPGISSAAWTANRAIYTKIRVGTAITVTKAYFRVSIAAGNIDVGIYDSTVTTKLGSTGSIACPVAGPANVSFSAGIALSANTIYYIAIACSGTPNFFAVDTTNALITGSPWKQFGYQETAMPLPATPSVTWENGAVYPVIYIG